MLANIITVSRMLFSLLLIGFSPTSCFFVICYLLCGLTDVLDGFVARKLHTESEKGAMLDSMADLIFAIVYAVKILPFLSVPVWILIWAVLICIIKITVILLKSKNKHKLFIEHSFGNKLMGILLFLLPLSTCIAKVKYVSVFVCAVATAVLITETARINGG